MSQKTTAPLPLAPLEYNFSNESLTRQQIEQAIQSTEDSLTLLKAMQESVTSKSIRRHQFLLMGVGQ
jgi:hypothetical protein|tara:strand:+ start:997 stop:1197 length:201 start_codon:yes stop_codon:yes gene_type:complete